jgi:hypothetical protein
VFLNLPFKGAFDDLANHSVEHGGCSSSQRSTAKAAGSTCCGEAGCVTLPFDEEFHD